MEESEKILTVQKLFKFWPDNASENSESHNKDDISWKHFLPQAWEGL